MMIHLAPGRARLADRSRYSTVYMLQATGERREEIGWAVSSCVYGWRRVSSSAVSPMFVALMWRPSADRRALRWPWRAGRDRQVHRAGQHVHGAVAWLLGAWALGGGVGAAVYRRLITDAYPGQSWPTGSGRRTVRQASRRQSANCLAALTDHR
jgi:hypothetical protein